VKDTVSPPGLVRFGAFEVDLRVRELRKNGKRVKLSGQPFEVLAILLETPGEIVTREVFQKRLWPADTFVDFDHGLNTAVNRLRDVLGDSADNPRFVETVPRRGYRLNREITTVVPASPEKLPPSTSRPWANAVAWSAAGLFLLIAAFIYFQPRRPRLASDPVTPSPFTAFPGKEVAPTLSPDGSQIAFAWDGDPASGSKGFDLFTKVSGSENLLRLTNHPSAFINPAWSPNGEQIAFHRIAGPETGIYVVPALGGPERKLVSTHATVDASGISWSPDAKRIAFVDSTSHGEHSRLSLLSVESLEITPIHHSEKCQDEVSPAFSRVGDQLAYVCIPGSGGFGLYTIALPDGMPRQVGLYAGWPNGIAWTSDGQSLVGSRDVEAGAHDELYEVTVANGQLRALRSGERGGEFPTISAKGDRLAYQAGHHAGVNIYRRDLLHPGREEVKVIASTRDSVFPRYSPDGKHIAFVSNRSGSFEIWMSNSDGTGIVNVSKLNNPQTGTPNWSPDSKKIVFDSQHNGQRGVYIVDIANLAPRQLTTNVPEPSQPSWSHDGKWIYFIAGGSPGRIYKCPPEGGNAVALSAGAGFFPQESVDGETVYFVDFSPGRAVLMQVSLKHPGTQSVVEGMPDILPTNWVVVQDGIFFLSQDDVTLSYFDFASRKVQQLLKMKDQGNVALSVSPDRHWLLFAKVEQPDWDIMLVEHFR
jgi:Tol biopolymer transport system component/DNA-binding winged helix-turn-helix (wHTH) protein